MSQESGRFIHERKMFGKFGNILVVIPRKFIGMWIHSRKEFKLNLLKWTRIGSNIQNFEYDIWDT